MPSYYLYQEEYNVESHLKKNEIIMVVDFESVCYIKHKKIKNPSSGEKPSFEIFLKNGNRVDLPLSSAEYFIKEYIHYKNELYKQGLK